MRAVQELKELLQHRLAPDKQVKLEQGSSPDTVRFVALRFQDGEQSLELPGSPLVELLNVQGNEQNVAIVDVPRSAVVVGEDREISFKGGVVRLNRFGEYPFKAEWVPEQRG